MDKITVRATPGQMLPVEGAPHRYVGWEECTPEEAEHVVPGGSAFRRCGAVEVPSTRYYRSALRRGDIEQTSSNDHSSTVEVLEAPADAFEPELAGDPDDRWHSGEPTFADSDEAASDSEHEGD